VGAENVRGWKFANGDGYAKIAALHIFKRTESGTVVCNSASYAFTLNGNGHLVANFYAVYFRYTVQTNTHGPNLHRGRHELQRDAVVLMRLPGSSTTRSAPRHRALASTGNPISVDQLERRRAIRSPLYTPTVVTTYTANFTLQFMLTMAAGTAER
jgi:hypothetical protein